MQVHLPSVLCAWFCALISFTLILDAPAGGSNLKRKSGSSVTKSQLEKMAVYCGESGSSLYVMRNLRGAGLGPFSIQICQSILSCVNARCSQGVPITVTGPTSVPEVTFCNRSL